MSEVGTALLDRARALGADLAGVASIDDLRGAGDVVWPEGARSILVVALAHPADRPELDWWHGRNDPPGNRMLARIVQDLCDWIDEEYEIATVHLPYHVERGGAYLKDAAVLAGLGCIGLNNLLVTPERGPRVRLRGLTMDAALPSTGPASFDPCAFCAAPCRAACPQGAFRRRAGEEAVLSGSSRGPGLPGRTGDFSRAACLVQMDLDVAAAADAAAAGDTAQIVRYCRACELSCPAGV